MIQIKSIFTLARHATSDLRQLQATRCVHTQATTFISLLPSAPLTRQRFFRAVGHHAASQISVSFVACSCCRSVNTFGYFYWREIIAVACRVLRECAHTIRCDNKLVCNLNVYIFQYNLLYMVCLSYVWYQWIQ